MTNDIYEQDILQCKKCKGSAFTFHWTFATEGQLMGAMMCHSGYGLELNSAKMRCCDCGAEGFYEDDDFIDIVTIISEGEEVK